MGVYVFRSRHADFVKVGHYIGDDAWNRVSRRGFYSCVSPREIECKRDACDLELIAWFPNLTTRHEGKIHRMFADNSSIGEWHAASKADDIVKALRALSEGSDEYEKKNHPSIASARPVASKRKQKNTTADAKSRSRKTNKKESHSSYSYVPPNLPDYAFTEMEDDVSPFAR